MHGLRSGTASPVFFPGGTNGTEPAGQSRRLRRRGFGPWVGKTPWRKAWQLTPVVLSAESNREMSLASYGPRGHKELDTTEVT